VSITLSLISVVFLATLHLLAPRIRRLPFVPEYATASFAGGIAVSYVFLHLLPELSQGNSELRELFQEEDEVSPLLGLEIFLVALLGFLVFYGFERLAERSQQSAGAQQSTDQGSHRTTTASDTGGRGGRGVFRLHLAAFAVYNAIIAYTLPLDWRISAPFAALFTGAMALHFVLTDRGLQEHYGDMFDRWTPRLLLAAALVVGWGLAVLFAPTSSVVVSVLTAFLAGSILLNVFKEEIPSNRTSHFGWFTAGLAAYALLLVLVTASAESGSAAEPQEDASRASDFRPVGNG